MHVARHISFPGWRGPPPSCLRQDTPPALLEPSSGARPEGEKRSCTNTFQSTSGKNGVQAPREARLVGSPVPVPCTTLPQYLSSFRSSSPVPTDAWPRPGPRPGRASAWAWASAWAGVLGCAHGSLLNNYRTTTEQPIEQLGEQLVFSSCFARNGGFQEVPKALPPLQRT